MKRIAHIAVIGVLVGLLGVCSKTPVDPGPSQSSGITMKAGAELEGAQISVVSAVAPSSAPNQTIEAGDSAVAFTGLEPGQYTVSVTMPDGRSFSTVVVVEPGRTYDLGEVVKLDSVDVKTIWHDPVTNYPDFIAWHYPMPNERLVFSKDPRSGKEIGRALVITFQFTKPMQRRAIQMAFGVAPTSNGVFAWNYLPAYYSTSGVEPYAIKSDYAMFVEGQTQTDQVSGGTASGSAGSGVSYPAMPPEPIEVDSNLVYGFSFQIAEENIVYDTTYAVTIASGAMDSSGRTIGSDYRFYFSLVPAADPYPYLVPTPSRPVSSQNTALQLVLGMSQSACDPTYTTSFTVAGNDIRLVYKEIQTDMACIMIAVDPHPYGPTFELGKLEAGDYRVYTADSQFVGAFSVSKPAVIGGTVLEMENPAIVHIRAPVLSGVVITAESNAAANWYMPFPVESEIVGDTTDSSGRFSLDLPPGYGPFKITAQRDGYYPQVLFWYSYGGGVRMLADGSSAVDSVASELTFELLDTAQKPLGDLALTVTRKGAAVESASVFLSAGSGVVYGPMPAMETNSGSLTGVADTPVSSRDVGTSSSYWAYTDANGKLTLTNVSLTPYIEFAYSASDRNGAYSSGTVRLNAFASKSLAIELPEPAVLPDSVISSPNPVPATR